MNNIKKVQFLFLIILFSGFFSNSQVAEKKLVNGCFGMEILSDSSILNCWEYYFYERGATGFFLLDSCGKPNFGAGFFMLSNPIDYLDEKEIYELLLTSRDSIEHANLFGKLDLINYYEWIDNQVSFFKFDSIISTYTYNEFVRPLKRRKIQKRFIKIIQQMHIGSSVMVSLDTIEPNMYFYNKCDLSVEYYSLGITESRRLLVPTSKINPICEMDIPIHIVLSMR